MSHRSVAQASPNGVPSRDPLGLSLHSHGGISRGYYTQERSQGANRDGRRSSGQQAPARGGGRYRDRAPARGGGRYQDRSGRGRGQGQRRQDEDMHLAEASSNGGKDTGPRILVLPGNEAEEAAYLASLGLGEETDEGNILAEDPEMDSKAESKKTTADN